MHKRFHDDLCVIASCWYTSLTNKQAEAKAGLAPEITSAKSEQLFLKNK